MSPPPIVGRNMSLPVDDAGPRDEGMVSAFLLTMTLGILALAGLGLDGGLALAAKIDTIGQAEQAARAGAGQIDLATYRATGTLQLDQPQARAAAQRFLAASNTVGIVTVTANSVTVVVTETHRTQLLGLVGVKTLTVTGTGRATPQHGITQAGG